jgi:hypothetical protein
MWLDDQERKGTVDRLCTWKVDVVRPSKGYFVFFLVVCFLFITEATPVAAIHGSGAQQSQGFL